MPKRTRLYCRTQGRNHAARRKNISRDIYGMEWYSNSHQFSKNKIHCSCWMCRFQGPSHSDMKKSEKDRYSLKIYGAGAEDLSDE